MLVSVPRVDATKKQATLRAVTLMKVMLDTPSDPLDNPMSAMMLQEAFASDEDLAMLVSGMSSLTVWLLVKLEDATGATPREILDDIARKVQ